MSSRSSTRPWSRRQQGRRQPSGEGAVLVAHPSPDLYGSDRVLLESVKALTGAGRRVVVALPRPGPLVPLLTDAGAQVRLVETLVLRKALLRPRGLVVLVAGALRTLPGMLREIRAVGADVVLVNTVTLPTWLLAARLLRRPVVCHVHEAEQLPRPLALLLHAPLLLADRLVVNSAAAGAVLVAALPALRDRVRLLYNGVPGPTTPAVPGRAQVSGAARLLLVGRLSPRKGTDVAVLAVVELLRRGVDVHLTVVGDVFAGYEWYREQLQALVAASGIEDQVTFVPFQDEVWPWFSAADVVLVPSRAEPFGNVAVEAALAQRPVVASAVQGLMEIVESGRTGVLVPADDPAALADAVEGLVGDWPAARRMAGRAHTEAARRFSPGAYRAGLQTVLSEVRGLPRPCAR